MTRAVLLLLLAVVFVSAEYQKILLNDPDYDQFAAFETQYKKVYPSGAERAHRFRLFKENLIRADQLNRLNGEPVFGVTKFSDLHPDEFRAMYLMSEPLDVTQLPEAPFVEIKSVDVPVDTYDWRTKNMVTALKNQEQCGSCWAFSATEQIESVWAIAGKTIVDLAPQQIVDCDKTCYGCNGGWSYLAFQYVIQAGGMEPESDYPYKAVDGTCKFNKADVAAHISGWKYVSKVAGDENSTMLPFVYETAPISVCVDAASWQLYKSGVLKTCGQSIDHCVQITGFSTQDGEEVWNVRNSWGADWGVDGYIYVPRNKNMCAIATVATTASV
jgi:cathepsin F